MLGDQAGYVGWFLVLDPLVNKEVADAGAPVDGVLGLGFVPLARKNHLNVMRYTRGTCGWFIGMVGGMRRECRTPEPMAVCRKSQILTGRLSLEESRGQTLT